MAFPKGSVSLQWVWQHGILFKVPSQEILIQPCMIGQM